MQDSTNGWVTYQRIPLQDGRVIVVQKKDGSTRSRVLPRPTPATSRGGGTGEMVTNGHINPGRD